MESNHETGIKYIPWYVRDATGAYAGVQTGAVGYGTLLGGPWGGFAVLVGCAAFSSMIK